MWKSAATIGAIAMLAGCSAPEPRSSEYFAAHIDEAREIVAGCTEGSVRGDECTNANLAVEEAKGRERFRRFLGKKSEE
jgi:hypothetical protein